MFVTRRRDFLRALFAGVATASVARPSAAQDAIGATRLTSRVLLFTGAGGNVVVLDSPDGVLMVNGGVRERSAALLAKVAQECGRRPVRTLVNTDWHPDHSGSNETLGAGGTRIIAHENTKQYLGSPMSIDWESRTYKPLARQGLPTETFYTTGTTDVGGERVEYAHLGQAHTDGDIYVFFREANVLACGDVVSVGAYPMPDYTAGGWLGGLVNATKALLDLSNADTRIVPGRGPVLARPDLQAQHDMLNTVRERVVKMMKQGMGAEEMVTAGVTKEFDARWGAPQQFVANVYRGMWLHVRELGGIV
jgi:glyoxylase-like metal-dependent hydrolase (beta-lactamase superfamily II)